MNLEDQILDSMVAGDTPGTIADALGISRAWYNKRIKVLEDGNRISRIGQLPDGATFELCPPLEAVALFDEMSRKVGWSASVVSHVRTAISRYGWITPTNPDVRYDRSQWSAHAVRRVDFRHTYSRADNRFVDYMVCSFLIPRMDNQPWYRATPQHRVVYVERDDGERWSWVAERGRVVSSHDIYRNVSNFFTQSEVNDMLLSVAFVCESRAILQTRIEG